MGVGPWAAPEGSRALDRTARWQQEGWASGRSWGPGVTTRGPSLSCPGALDHALTREAGPPRGAEVEGFCQSHSMGRGGSWELQETGTGDVLRPAKCVDKDSQAWKQYRGLPHPTRCSLRTGAVLLPLHHFSVAQVGTQQEEVGLGHIQRTGSLALWEILHGLFLPGRDRKYRSPADAQEEQREQDTRKCCSCTSQKQRAGPAPSYSLLGLRDLSSREKALSRASFHRASRP